MSLAVAAGILGFTKDALGLIGDARGADLAQRNRLADYCARVGDAGIDRRGTGGRPYTLRQVR